MRTDRPTIIHLTARPAAALPESSRVVGKGPERGGRNGEGQAGAVKFV